ncbi:hypothetical protein CTAYLR_007496 [Chrysophaeum taylorii]|uniref:Uncharacterized protein n=1 Tax=Chrysophaeum taylorii TaxID=2483200 RepID=A0AAD7XNQ8_9STRA|nr:hypothetical protein CTAYLR_007496 [Chrysophaeum taylorii]
MRVIGRASQALPFALAVVCLLSLRRGISAGRRVGQLDVWRWVAAVSAGCGRVVATSWTGDAVHDVFAAMSALAALVAGYVGLAEARMGLRETTILRVAWLVIGAGACYDTVMTPCSSWRFWVSVAWSVLACSAAVAYAGFNAGERRATKASPLATNALELEYELLEDADEEETPEDAAGPLSTIVFAWMSPLLSLGYARPLEPEDLYPLTRDDDPDAVATKLDTKFQQRLRKSPLTPDKALLGALAAAFGGYWYVGCLLKFVYDTAQLAQPLLLSALLKSMTQYKRAHHRDGRRAAEHNGYVLCTLMVANAMLATAVLHQYFQRTYRTGMRLKSSTTSLVFDKALVARNLASKPPERKRKTNALREKDDEVKDDDEETKEDDAAQRKATTNTVANLMSVDAQRLQDTMTYLATVGSGIYQIAACLYLLYIQLGWASFGGFAVMLVFLPITQRVILMSRGFQRRVLVHKDARIKLQSEALGGMKIIKMYGWEDPLAAELKRLRVKELAALWKYKLVNVLSRVVFSVVPTAVSLCTFAMYVLLGNKLTVSRVYTSLALFNILRFPLMMVPRAIGSAVEAMLSIERIGTYLASEEVTPLEPIGSPTNPLVRVAASTPPRVYARGADIEWPKPPTPPRPPALERQPSNEDDDDRALLDGLDFDLGPGTLTAVIGETGSGKSGLLVSLLGETAVVAGSLGVTGSIAYAAQTAWIRNATLKENILFGAPMDRARYEEVIERCALVQDLAELASGDETEIGEKGLTLSGGQKQRVALARALYADADVYLLDDVLSAVDAHVAVHLFDRVICHLRDIGKVVVFVTHNLSTLRRCDRVICLNCANRAVEYSGAPQGFAQLGVDAPDAHPLAAIAAKKLNSSSNLAAFETHGGKNGTADGGSTSTTKETSPSSRADGEGEQTGGTRLIADEARQKGGVSRSAQRAYLAATGGLFAASIVVAAQLIYQVSAVVASWWLGYWSAKPQIGTGPGLEVYAGVSVAAVVVSCVAYYLMSLIGQRAAHKMHDDLLDNLLKAPMKFFDSTPLGRLVNLFSKDLYTIDEELPITLAMWLTVGSVCLMTIATIAYATPWFLVVVLPLGGVYYSTMVYFIPTVRELKRLDATSRSPVFSSFNEALDGATTIRAFRAEARFAREVTHRLRVNLRAYFLGTCANRWLAVRLEMLGTFITGAAGFLAVVMSIKPYLAGLSLTYALSVTQALNWFVRMNADLENNSVAVERVVQYSDVDPEIDGTISAPDGMWPSRGYIEVKDLSLRYRPELPLVLKGLAFDVHPGTKLALVGRTGSGKSSFLLALLRIAPPTGAILIDGLDILRMRLSDVRNRVTMIPQDPILFSGTIRFNVDPFGSKTDAQVHQSLRDAQLTERLARLGSDPLAAVVEEGGRNFSVGEAQLLCLARACLRHSKLLLLDEATSSVDESLDDRIQSTIRTKFAASTVIAIAHRINTVVDYDRVLVLDHGTIVEDGSPSALMSQPTSVFAQLAAAHAKGVGGDD